ncbi:serine hydrolase domain-containing protein [Microbacterium sp. gxy059]|uniref:serine hydrolase domain-containing protein n=1 Tax=Microbacterium sp. gxy059 TaxID=2957199 RepID=UPI003D978F48
MRSSLRRSRLAGAVAALAAAGLLLTACTGDADPGPAESGASLPGDIQESLEAAVEHAIQGSGASGAIVGVWTPWGGDWVSGVGETSPGSGETPSADMTFRAGQITRSMTCDVLFSLEDDGVVSREDVVTEYVPSVPGLSEVTLGDLCDDVSGIHSSRSVQWRSFSRNLTREWGPREFIAPGLARGISDAGTWSDSDTGYFVLGLALENASHTSMEALIDEYVASPLGLQDTVLPGPTAAEPGALPLPGLYTTTGAVEQGCEGDPGNVTTLSASFGYADAGVVSSIGDLRVYASSLAETAGDSEDLPARWADSLPVNPNGAQWQRTAGGDRLLGSLIGQQGSMPGYATAAYSDIDSGLTVAVVLNNSAASDVIAGSLARELAAIAAQAPATDGGDRPEISLPWTVEQARESVSNAAVCPIGEG